MFNLLPQEHQRDIRKEYIHRRRTLFFFILCFVFVSGFITLLPSYVLSVQKENEVLTLEAKDDNVQTADILKLNKSVTELKANASLVITDTPKKLVHEIFAEILGKASSNISIKSLLYRKQGADPLEVSVVGVAKTREGLLSFAKALESIPSFSHVDVPVSNFAKDKNIEFSLVMVESKTQ